MPDDDFKTCTGRMDCSRLNCIDRTRIRRILKYGNKLMRNTSIFILLMVLGVLLMVSACNRKVIPGVSDVKAVKEYNQAAFNSFFVEGTKQKLMGNLGESLRYFEQCLSMNPESDATYYQMAQIMINNGDLVSGKKYINKAVGAATGEFMVPDDPCKCLLPAEKPRQRHNML